MRLLHDLVDLAEAAIGCEEIESEVKRLKQKISEARSYMSSVRSYWYLATPYSKYPGGRDAAYRMALQQTLLFVRAKIDVFSPIVYTHAMHGIAPDLPHTADFWLTIDLPFMETSCGLIIVKATGWDTSDGIEREYEWFQQEQKPIVWMELDHIPLLP